MKTLVDLYKRPTFVSVLGTLVFVWLLLVIIYQILFVDLGGGSSLGVVLEVTGVLIIIFLIIVDRILLHIIKNLFWLSIFEAILIISYLVNYYVTHDNSFSIG